MTRRTLAQTTFQRAVLAELRQTSGARVYLPLPQQVGVRPAL